MHSIYLFIWFIFLNYINIFIIILYREGALKIKEITYIHAEAICGGEMKHGPIAMIDSSTKEKTTKVVLIILENENLSEMILCLSEVNSR